MSKPERRRKSRIRRKAKIQFESVGVLSNGEVLNFSEDGLYVRSERMLPPGAIIRVPIQIAKNITTELHGKIVWSRYLLAEGEAKPHVGMGVELSAVPGEYLRFIEQLRSQVVKNPRQLDERYEVYHKVTFSTGQEFLTEYTENLSRGGMYLATDNPLPEGSPITAQLDIPGIEEPLNIAGRVAYSLSQGKAEEMGRAPGMGIQFVDLPAEAKARLHQYIHRLEIHRSKSERRQLGEIPLAGQLSDFLVPEVLLNLSIQEKTGTLILQRKGISKLVYIQNGHPIYVESNLRTENLGQFLVRQQKITQAQLEETFSELTQGEPLYGSFLIDQGILPSSDLALALVSFHEEKIINTFPWFDGTYEFVEGADWPESFSMIPMRAHNIIFSGIIRWYDETLVSSWMGLDEQTQICKSGAPSSHIQLPPLVQHLITRLHRPKTVRKLCEQLRAPISQVLPAVYGLVIAGWADIDFSKPEEGVSVTEFKKPIPSEPKKQGELVNLLRRWIDEDFERLKRLDFFELLGIPEDVNEKDLTYAYRDRTSRYDAYEIHLIEDQDIQQKTMQILAWLKLAFDILKDKNMRQTYSRRGSKKVLKTDREFEVNHILFSTLRDFEAGNFIKALQTLEAASKKFPDPTIKGYMGWAYFQRDRQLHIDISQKLLDEALSHDPSDPRLHYYRGEIFSFLGEWRKAEVHFDHAVRLYPNFIEASIALELVRKRVH